MFMEWNEACSPIMERKKMGMCFETLFVSYEIHY